MGLAGHPRRPPSPPAPAQGLGSAAIARAQGLGPAPEAAGWYPPVSARPHPPIRALFPRPRVPLPSSSSPHFRRQAQGAPVTRPRPPPTPRPGRTATSPTKPGPPAHGAAHLRPGLSASARDAPLVTRARASVVPSERAGTAPGARGSALMGTAPACPRARQLPPARAGLGGPALGHLGVGGALSCTLKARGWGRAEEINQSRAPAASPEPGLETTGPREP